MGISFHNLKIENHLWRLGLVYKPMGPTIQLEEELDPEEEQQRMLRSFKIAHTLPDMFKEMMDKKLEILPKQSEKSPDCSLASGLAYLFGFCK